MFAYDGDAVCERKRRKSRAVLRPVKCRIGNVGGGLFRFFFGEIFVRYVFVQFLRVPRSVFLRYRFIAGMCKGFCKAFVDAAVDEHEYERLFALIIGFECRGVEIDDIVVGVENLRNERFRFLSRTIGCPLFGKRVHKGCRITESHTIFDCEVLLCAHEFRAR